MDECSICLENIENDDVLFVTKCLHKFHKDCIVKLRENDHYKCPMCREIIFEMPVLPKINIAENITVIFLNFPRNTNDYAVNEQFSIFQIYENSILENLRNTAESTILSLLENQ